MSDRQSAPSPSTNLQTDCSNDLDQLAEQIKYDIQPEQEIQPEAESPPAPAVDNTQELRSARMIRANQNAGDGVGQAAEEA